MILAELTVNEIGAGGLTLGEAALAFIAALRYVQRTEDGTVANLHAENEYLRGELDVCRADQAATMGENIRLRVRNARLVGIIHRHPEVAADVPAGLLDDAAS